MTIEQFMEQYKQAENDLRKSSEILSVKNSKSGDERYKYTIALERYYSTGDLPINKHMELSSVYGISATEEQEVIDCFYKVIEEKKDKAKKRFEKLYQIAKNTKIKVD